MEETILENEEQTVKQAAETQAPDTPARRHSLGTLIREMWPAYLIEIGVIILGISITLGLEEWRDHKKDQQLEQVYQRNLLADIDTDIRNIKNAATRTESLLERGNELLGFIQHPADKNITAGGVNGDVKKILDRPKFIASDATFSDLKSSGNLHLLKDIRLKNLLFAYYNQAQNIRGVQDAEQLATINLSGAFFLKHFPLDNFGPQPVSSDGENIAAMLLNIEFQNNVLLRVLNRKELLGDYQRADSLAELLKTALTEKNE